MRWFPSRTAATAFLAAASLAAAHDHGGAAQEGGHAAEAAAAAAASEPAAVQEEPPVFHPEFKPTTRRAVFLEQFLEDWEKRWSPSEATRRADDGAAAAKSDPDLWRYRGKWQVEEAGVYPGLQGDRGLVLKTAAAHHAISSPFDVPIDPAGKDLVVQYEVKLQNGLECGGAYLKLLMASEEEGIQAKDFTNETPYTIMFGPDKCGATNKVHFIFRHKNPKTGEFEEKHLDPAPLARTDKLSTLYTLIVRPNNSYELRVNNDIVSSGSLLENFKPPVNPPKEIADPDDKKPADWVDEAKISDPNAKKPEDWDEDAPFEILDLDAKKPDDWLEDEPETIPDPDAVKPDDWNDEEDGEWVPPLVPNPKCETAAGCGKWTTPVKRNPAYKGKWKAPMIDNPAYKGVWKPRMIPNPKYYEDKNPANLSNLSGIGFELWTMQADIMFDNIFVGHDVGEAENFAQETWKTKVEVEKAEENRALARNRKLPEAPPLKEAGVPFTKDPMGFVENIIFSALSKVTGIPADGLKAWRPYSLGAAMCTAALLAVLSYAALSGVLSSRRAATDDAQESDAVVPGVEADDDEITGERPQEKEAAKKATAQGDAAAEAAVLETEIQEGSGSLRKRAAASSAEGTEDE